MSYQQQMYNRLRQAGMTEAGALGVLGNWECESNCEPFRVQNDFSPTRTASRIYVQQLESGVMSVDQFATDQRGFGAAQWTYGPRKRNMYSEWKASGRPIDSVEFQVDFAVAEFKRDFIPDWRLLCSTSDIYEATKAVCYRFENPAVKNVDARFQAAKRIQNEIDLNEWRSSTPSPEPQNDDVEPHDDHVKETEYWPPRMICAGMNGYDVMVLQAVLKARGYINPYIDGEFGTYLEKLVKAFQTDYGLDPDGIVGPLTWGKLLERK